MSKAKAQELGIKPLLQMLTIVAEGVDPKVMGLGPAVAIPKALRVAGLTVDEIDYWEINEAFAAQYIGVTRMLKQDFNMAIDPAKVNHNGSGIVKIKRRL